MRQRLLTALVTIGLGQGIYAEYQCSQLSKDKAELQSIIDSDVRSACHRIVERGL
jgi:hypothetical protein